MILPGVGVMPQGRSMAPAAPRCNDRRSGGVPEWSIGPVSKTGVPATAPWVRIPPPPPVPACVVLSARPEGPLRGRFPGVFGTDLLTGAAPGSGEIALRVPFLSGPVDLGDLVRNSESPIKGRFQRGRHLRGIESHLPEISTSGANTLVRIGCPVSHSCRQRLRERLLRLLPEILCTPCPSPQPGKPPEGSA